VNTINWNIFVLLSLVSFICFVGRRRDPMQEEIQGRQALRVACLQGQWQRKGSVSRACVLHAALLLAGEQPEPIPSRLLGTVIKLSISRRFCFVP
jgi:hypothetical protein